MSKRLIFITLAVLMLTASFAAFAEDEVKGPRLTLVAVSYTHLTLPTKRIV